MCSDVPSADAHCTCTHMSGRLAMAPFARRHRERLSACCSARLGRYHDTRVKTPRGNGLTPRTPRSVRFSDEPQEEGPPQPRTPCAQPLPSPRRSPRPTGSSFDMGRALQVVVRPVGRATGAVAKAPLQVSCCHGTREEAIAPVLGLRRV